MVVAVIRHGDGGYGGTSPLAEVGMVARRADDPIVPAQLLEADVQVLPAALAGGGPALQGSAPAPLAGVLGVEDEEGPVLLVEGDWRSPQLQ